MEWQIVTCDAADFDMDVANAMQCGQVPGVRLQNFISEEAAGAMLREIRTEGIEYYAGEDKAGGEARKGKFGPNFYRFRQHPEQYFELMKHFLPVFDRIFSACNPPRLLREVCAKAFGIPAVVAENNGTQMMPATVRDLPAAPVHFDWLPIDCPMLEFAPAIKEQFAWNLFLELPERGGYTLVHNVDARAPGDHPRDTLWAGIEHNKCDLAIFRSTHRHMVVPGEGNKSRITLSGFFGLCEGRLIFWV